MEAALERFFPLSGPAAMNLLRSLSSWEVWRATLAIFMCFVLVTFMVGCSISGVQSAIQTVLNDLPTILNIVSAIVAIVGAAKGLTPQEMTTLNGEVAQYEQEAKADLGTIQNILTAYKTGLGNAPASAITELDAAVSAISTNLTSLEQAFHVASATTQASIAVVVAAVSSFLLGVTSLIPASVMAMAPRMSTLLRAAGIKPGSSQYIIPSRRQLSKTFNANIGKLCPSARVHVPWIRLAGIPVLP